MLIRRKYFKMFAALSLLSSVYGYASSSSSTHEGLSIREMRKQCEDLRSDTQRKKEEIVVNCTGLSIIDDRQENTVTKDNMVNFFAQANTKSGLYMTEPTEIIRKKDPLQFSCARIELKALRAPAGGVKVYLSSCNELTRENLERQCRKAINSHCADNTVDLNAQAKGEGPVDTSGSCTVESQRVIDTCAAYEG